MIAPRALTPRFAVTGQVGVGDIGVIGARYRTLINNRPDGEEPGQPFSAELEAAARSVGLRYAYIPISGEIADADVAAFDEALSANPGPVLASCRTGSRSARLWALAQAGRCSVKRILAAATSAGYDLQSLAPRLRQADPKSDA